MTEIITEHIHPSVHYRQYYEKEALGKREKEIYQPICMPRWGGVGGRPGWERVEVKGQWGKGFSNREGYNQVLKNEEWVIERSLWEFEIGTMPQNAGIEL